MTDDQFDQLIRDAAITYNRPADAPLDEMWDEIQPARVARAPRSLVWRVASLAAVLVVGIALGRASSKIGATAPAADQGLGVAEQPTAVPQHGGVATSQYLGQTTALLIALPAELHERRPDSGFVARANDLLLTTRVLLDSPAASDSSLRSLFEDLELVLAQVVRIQQNRTPAEIDLINQALEQRDVLPRLESAAVGASEDE
jgi:hypothetical protein